MRNIGVHQGLAPVVDVLRDPRWGRTEETYGEDPYLIACLGLAYVKGLQGDNLKNGVVATLKHFGGHSFSEGGRNLAPVNVGLRAFREEFLFPFEAIVKEGKVKSVMNSYCEVDGIPATASKELLTNLLREEWKFDGIVISDYDAVIMLNNFHHVAKDEKEAACLALKAGIDIELPNSTKNLFGDYHYTAHLSVYNVEDSVKVVSILEGMKNKVSSKTKVYFAKGCELDTTDKSGFPEAIDIVKESDAVILALGEKSGMFGSGISGEGCDRTSSYSL
ncbi:MAG: glycoside hydrolase family 3 N-terminal domain-containing protein [Candidatus Firestonebacteria bacterium]